MRVRPHIRTIWQEQNLFLKTNSCQSKKKLRYVNLYQRVMIAKVSRWFHQGCRGTSLRCKFARQSRLRILKLVCPSLAKGKVVERVKLAPSLVVQFQVRILIKVMHIKGSKPEFLWLNLKKMSLRCFRISQELRKYVTRYHMRLQHLLLFPQISYLDLLSIKQSNMDFRPQIHNLLLRNLYIH